MSSAALNLFVTGGSGFIGGRVVRDLLSHGHAVRALARGHSAVPEGCTPVPGNLTDVAGFAEALRGCDAVVHAAALVHPIADAGEADRINRDATIDLARAAAERGVGCFVFLSSIAAIGIRDLPDGVPPDVVCRPGLHGSYGRSKRAAERGVLDLDREAMRVVVARPPLVYGAGEHRNFLELTRAINSGFFVIPGRGDNQISFCHVDNLASAVRCLVERPEARGVYHVADAAPVSLRAAAETIACHLGRRLLPLPFPMPLARAVATICELAARPLGIHPPLGRGRLKTLTSNFVLDCTSLHRIGYRPSISFDAGVRETVAWYRSEGLLGSPPTARTQGGR